VSSARAILGLFGLILKRERAKWRLHPLIHTFTPGTSAPDVEKKKAEPRTPHFLSLNQDMVTSNFFHRWY
jgi:hypothetical protein